MALPQRKPLTPGEVRQLVRECVTVAKPGEILVLRPGTEFTPNQLREIQQMVNCWLEHNVTGIKALVIPGEAAQIMRQEPDDEQAEEEVEKINQILRAHGFEYPLGSRGVQDLADGYRVRQEELHHLDPEHWAAVSDCD